MQEPVANNTDFFSRAAAIVGRPQLQKVPDELFDSYGHHWDALFQLYPVLFFIPVFFILRKVCKAFVFPPVARYFGITGRAVPKFSYQGWLLIFYTLSTIYGYFCLRNKPWVSFPLGESEKISIDANFRSTPHTEVMWYYSYQIGFFLAELYVICTEPKRPDFVEYLLHHIVTLYLLVFSWVAYEHRIGSYVLIIHDVVDIFLCLSRMTHYAKARALVMVPTFIAFASSYAFFRLYCLPVLSISIFTTTLKLHDNFATTCLGVILAFALQALHVFWFYLILRIIWNAVTKGAMESVRSDDEADGTNEKRKNPKKAASQNKKVGSKTD